jgi:hypothetical protein
MFDYGFVHYRAIDYGHVIGGECFEDTVGFIDFFRTCREGLKDFHLAGVDCQFPSEAEVPRARSGSHYCLVIGKR